MATPSITSASQGMTSPAATTTKSPRRRVDAGTAQNTRRSAGSSSFLAKTAPRARRRASACAWPRPSAIASAKLANSTVNHSQAATPRMKPAGASPCPRSACDAQGGREQRAHQHHEHHRVAELDPRVELAERLGQPPGGRAAARTGAAPSVWPSLGSSLRQCAPASIRCSTTGPSARAGNRVSAPTTSTVATTSSTNSGVWVGSVPGPAGSLLLGGQRAGQRQHGHHQPVAADEHGQPQGQRRRRACPAASPANALPLLLAAEENA